MLYPGTTNLTKNCIVGYNLFKGPAIGVVLNNAGNSVRVLIRNRKEFSLKSASVFLMDGGLSENADKVSVLSHREEEIKRLAAEIDLSLLWDILLEDGREVFELEELLEIYYGSGNFGFCEIMAMAKVLDTDPCYIKRKKSAFQPNTPEGVQAWFDSVKALQEKEQREKKVLELLQLPDFSDEIMQEWNELFEDLKDIAIQHNKSDKYAKYGPILKKIGLDSRPELREFLTERGVFSVDTPFDLLEIGYPLSFSSSFVDYMRVLQSIPRTDKCSRDLRHLKTFTIDGESTEDRDDAMSFDPGNGRFYVHITNIARLVEGDARVEKELEKRLTSLYFPDSYYAMFPRQLNPFLSLNEGEERYVMTVEFELTPGGPKYDIYPALIKVDKNYSYDFVQKKKENQFEGCFAIAERLRSFRDMHGAITYCRPFEIDIKVGHEIVLRRKPHLESQEMVAEFNILANYAFARYCRENNIPIFYRIQSGNHEHVEKHKHYAQRINDFFQYYQLKRSWGATKWDVKETAHFSLGLSHYTQMSSPMRRFIDFFNQQQLWKYFSGRSFFSVAELETRLAILSGTIYEINSLQDKRRKYFILRHLEQEIAKSAEKRYTTCATVLESFSEGLLLYLDEFGEIFQWKSGHDGIKPGSHITVRINSVDVSDRVLRGNVI
jgi:exoribonuclease-2